MCNFCKDYTFLTHCKPKGILFTHDIITFVLDIVYLLHVDIEYRMYVNEKSHGIYDMWILEFIVVIIASTSLKKVFLSWRLDSVGDSSETPWASKF